MNICDCLFSTRQGPDEVAEAEDQKNESNDHIWRQPLSKRISRGLR
jgi:hypothetical protein